METTSVEKIDLEEIDQRRRLATPILARQSSISRHRQNDQERQLESNANMQRMTRLLRATSSKQECERRSDHECLQLLLSQTASCPYGLKGWHSILYHVLQTSEIDP